MASASFSMNNVCFHCKCATANCRNGWQLRDGSFAQLCERCGSTYDNGTFCETFHLDSDGWRDCVTCKKMLHCGCIVSANLYIIMDYGGICCNVCATKYSILAEVEYIFLNACPQFWQNLGSGSRYHRPKVEFLVDSEEPMTDNISGGDSVSSACSAMHCTLSQDTVLALVMPNSPAKEQCALEYISTVNSLSEAHISSGSHVSNGGSSGVIHPQNLPKISEEEHLKIQGDSNSAITFLFEKVLTASDTDLKTGRLVIPKKCAEAYFPEVVEPNGVILKAQDTTGKEWLFNYHFWINCHSRMYILEGLREYMALMQWQPGDVVTFSRIDPEGKLLVGTRKASAPPVLEGCPQIHR